MTQLTQPSQRMALLPKVIKQFASISSLDELCKAVVLSTTRKLSFDRCGCFLFDPDNYLKQGMWGTAPDGSLADERNMTAPIHTHEMEAMHSDRPVIVLEHHKLYHQEQIIGIGTLIQCTIFDNDKLLGWLFIDNYMSNIGFSQQDIDFITLYGSIVGQLIVRQQHQEKLVNQNQMLNSTIQILEETQKQLVETEKMAALGQLVTGIAHELNTPIGVSLTAVSHVEKLASQLNNELNQGTLSASHLQQSLADITKTIGIGQRSIARSTALINDFKQLLQNGPLSYTEVSLEGLLQKLFSIHKQAHHEKEITLHLSIDADTTLWRLPEQALIKVFGELIKNSLRHGFLEQNHGDIWVDVSDKQTTKDEILLITYRDNGVGMKDKVQHLFDPFYTTNRQLGTGLGASIIYNVVTQMNGQIAAYQPKEQGLELRITLPVVASHQHIAQ